MVQLDSGTSAVDLSQWSDAIGHGLRMLPWDVPRMKVLPGRDFGQPILMEKEDLRLSPKADGNGGRPS